MILSARVLAGWITAEEPAAEETEDDGTEAGADDAPTEA
jgi:hypothetical protein